MVSRAYMTQNFNSIPIRIKPFVIVTNGTSLVCYLVTYNTADALIGFTVTNMAAPYSLGQLLLLALICLSLPTSSPTSHRNIVIVFCFLEKDFK
eukprot:m.43445 g.43445  ORF g.43445 m.43445 type:complete len:94 (-) comp10558_c0_seq6:87-368(-)